jgi:hypothetical protein
MIMTPAVFLYCLQYEECNAWNGIWN